MFLNVDDYEYPQTNNTLRQRHKQRWLDYYECLKETYVEKVETNYPSALMALEGTSVTCANEENNMKITIKRECINLKCEICISPAEMHIADLIEWYFNSSCKNDIVKSTVQSTDHILSSPDNQYIVMYNLQPQQAGVYWCEMKDTVGSIYYLHIDSDLDAVNVLLHPNASRAALVESVPEYGLEIYTAWTAWNPCSTCSVVGIKLRYGYCTMSLNERVPTTDESQYTRKEEKDEWNQTDETTQMAIINENLKVQLKTTLLLFKNRLPCKSRLIPKQIRMMPFIKNKKTEVMKGYCKKKCRKNIIFEVRDEKGNVLEHANNSAGIYSMIQGMPELLPSVVRSVLYEKHNKKTKLICPGNLNTDVPIIWRIDNKEIIPSLIEHQSNGRIRINSEMHILFESLRFEDANTYSCWQNNEVAGIIKLNVTGEIEFKLNHHILIIGASLIITVLLIVFWRVFKRRTRYTTYHRIL